MVSAVSLIQNGGVSFGTSGARGLVESFTPEVCAAFTLAFLGSQKGCKRVAIGIDNRPSSPDIASACIAAANHAGVEVDYYGVLPTPALAYTSMADQIPAIMVTGSHIPFDRNGLKFYRADGEISKSDEQAILSVDIPVPALSCDALPPVSSRAVDRYIARYIDLYPADELTGKKIGIYEHSSAGRDVYSKIFTALGAEVISLGRSDSFVPIDTEAVSRDDIAMAQAWQKEFGLNAVFSTDGDGDRPLLSDETGTYLRGDVLCLLAAKALDIDALAIPVSCNSAIEKTGAFSKVHRTKIGSPYVVAAMSELESDYGAVAGFEANGGFLLGCDIHKNDAALSALPTRDAVLPAIAVLAASKHEAISDMVNALPSRYTASDRLQNFAREKSLSLIDRIQNDPNAFFSQLGLSAELKSVNQTDGLRMTLSDDCIVHLRPSGNAPELRCYTEASKQEEAEKLLHSVFAFLRAQV